MKTKQFAILTVIIGVLMGVPIVAHHAASSYDRDHPITLKGTVTEYRFSNPHVQIHFEVQNTEGLVERWIAESGPPQRLYRTGWTTKSLKPGDQITVTGLPMKDGRKQLSVRKLIAPNGQELGEGAE